MADRYSIAEARRNLPTLVRTAESDTAIELTRHGESVAVRIGWKAFERLAAGRRRFTEAYGTFERDADLPTLTLNPDAVFGTVRPVRSRFVWAIISNGKGAGGPLIGSGRSGGFVFVDQF